MEVLICLILLPHPRTVRWLASLGVTIMPLIQKAFITQQWNLRAQEWGEPPIQQLHTLILLVGNLCLSWDNFTYSHSPPIYIYPICILYIKPIQCHFSFSLVPSKLLTRITMDFSFASPNLTMNQNCALHLHLTLWEVLLELPFFYFPKYKN